MFFFIIFFSFFIHTNNNVHAFKGKLNLRPIIAIVSQKVTEQFTPNVTDSDTYIAASYVKQMEMAGAQVVPLLPTYSKEKKKEIIFTSNLPRIS